MRLNKTALVGSGDDNTHQFASQINPTANLFLKRASLTQPAANYKDVDL